MESDLRLNKFNLYYKPYSLWSISCSSDYSTYDIQAQGKLTGDLTKLFKGLFIVTLITYILAFVNQIFSMLFLEKAIGYLFFGLEFLSFIAMIVMYCLILKGLNGIDRDMIQYAVDNNCSDGVLHYSMKQFLDNFSHDYSVVSAGLAFSLLSIIVFTIAIIFFSPMRNCFARSSRFEHLGKSSKFEDLLSEKREIGVSKMRNLLKRNIKNKLQEKIQ